MNDALLIIDMLNDFVLPGAPLEVPKTRAIVKKIKQELDKARAKGRTVIYICDAHTEDDPEFSRMGWPPHAICGTEGAAVISELAPQKTDPLIEKTGYSGFYQTPLDELLQNLNIQHLTLTGCVTNICILYTAYDAVIRGYEVTVLADCVADLNAEDGAFALKQLTEVLGAKVA